MIVAGEKIVSGLEILREDGIFFYLNGMMSAVLIDTNPCVRLTRVSYILYLYCSNCKGFWNRQTWHLVSGLRTEISVRNIQKCVRNDKSSEKMAKEYVIYELKSISSQVQNTVFQNVMYEAFYNTSMAALV